MTKALTIVLDGEVIGSNFTQDEATEMAGLCSSVASSLLQQAKQMREQEAQAQEVAGNGNMGENLPGDLPDLALMETDGKVASK